MNDDLLTLLDAFPALDEQGGTLFIRDTDRGVANLLDVPEADVLMSLVTAVPRLREALLKAQTTVERLARENDGLSARLTETRREHDAEVTLLHDELAEVRAENDRLRTTRYEDAAGVLAAARADAATWNARATALERDTARGDLDAVRRVLAEGLGADAKESDLDALALAARACETIDCLRAQVTSITTAVDALTSTERDDDRADAAQMRAGWRALSAESDALRQGETTPSLDAIRAWEAHGGVWLRVWPSERADLLRVSVATEDTAGHFRGEVVVRPVAAGSAARTYTPSQFTTAFEGARWWRVAPDGTLTVAEASS